MQSLVITGFVVAVMAAVRSTWSPCGLSMLSSITPMGERGRGNRFRRTAAWFIVGAVLGGACLGGGAGVLALGWGSLGVPHSASLAVGALCAALAVLGDLGLLGFQVPVLRRQVNERWLDQFRGVVYGVGFGWQIGVGVATYIMTTGVLLTAALGVLSGQLWVALALGTTFGTVRGLAVLFGARATTPDALRRIHRRMDELGAPVRRVTVAVQLGVGLVLAGCWWSPSLVVAVPVALVGASVLGVRPALRRRLRRSGVLAGP